jgi:site-specific recombinase
MWDWGVWAALIFGALAGIGALTLLAVRARQAWHGLKETRRAVAGGLDKIAANAEAVAEKVAAAGDTVELQESLRRLRHSLARLAVLRSALDEASAAFTRVTAVVPRR